MGVNIKADLNEFSLFKVYEEFFYFCSLAGEEIKILNIKTKAIELTLKQLDDFKNVPQISYLP